MAELYAYLPCYNEEENIEKLIIAWLEQQEKISECGYELQIVPFDDKSKDSTLSIIKRLEAEHPNVRVMAHEVNGNLGGVLGDSIRDFLDRSKDGDLFCFMDGDNSHRPEYVISMIRALSGKKYDCAIASRYRKGSEILGVPGYRQFLSLGARAYYTVVLHVPRVRDYTCGYRLYTRDILALGYEKYGDKLVSMKTFSCMMELLYKLHASGCRFTEVPFVLRYDEKGGDSKMNVAATTKDSITVALKLALGKL